MQGLPYVRVQTLMTPEDIGVKIPKEAWFEK